MNGFRRTSQPLRGAWIRAKLIVVNSCVVRYIRLEANLPIIPSARAKERRGNGSKASRGRENILYVILIRALNYCAAY